MSEVYALPESPRPTEIFDSLRWKPEHVEYKYYGTYPIKYLDVACRYERVKDAYKECVEVTHSARLCKEYVNGRKKTPLCWAYKFTELKYLWPIVVVDLDAGTAFVLLPSMHSVEIYGLSATAYKQFVYMLVLSGIIKPGTYVFVYVVHGNYVVGWYRAELDVPAYVTNPHTIPEELLWERERVVYKYYGWYERGAVKSVCSHLSDERSLRECYNYCSIEYEDWNLRRIKCKDACHRLVELKRKTPLCWAHLYGGLSDGHAVIIRDKRGDGTAYALLPSRRGDRVHIHAFASRLTDKFMELMRELNLVHTNCVDTYEVSNYVIVSKQSTCSEDSNEGS